MKRGVKRSIKGGIAANSKNSGAVRIISGRFRGRKLPVLDVQGLRPTTDKNKEMLFNWLMHDLRESRCLDAFAGSGGLGFEALSRYARSCTFIELDKKAATTLSDNIKLLGLSTAEAKLIQGNTMEVLRQTTEPFELIFVDPPFHQEWLPKVIEVLVDKALLAYEGLIYIECEPQAANYSVPDSWRIIKEKESAQIVSRLYRRVD